VLEPNWPALRAREPTWQRQAGQVNASAGTRVSPIGTHFGHRLASLLRTQAQGCAREPRWATWRLPIGEACCHARGGSRDARRRTGPGHVAPICWWPDVGWLGSLGAAGSILFSGSSATQHTVLGSIQAPSVRFLPGFLLHHLKHLFRHAREAKWCMGSTGNKRRGPFPCL
jgi:hypothetical protein